MIASKPTRENREHNRRVGNSSRLECSSLRGPLRMLLQELSRGGADSMYHSGPIRKTEETARTGPFAVLAKYCYLLCLAFRTLAQRCLCASAIRSRASLLRIRLPLLDPFAPPSADNAFPTLSISRCRREYSLCRVATALFRLLI